jgi:hypothetical protein
MHCTTLKKSISKKKRMIQMARVDDRIFLLVISCMQDDKQGYDD